MFLLIPQSHFMKASLSIRSYSTKPTQHSHEFHQLVMPLRGVISIQVECFNGKVSPGECVVVRRTATHLFTADSLAKFVVADLPTLPDNILAYPGVVFSLSAPLSYYLSFVEQQLEQQINPALEQSMCSTFYQLLDGQTLLPRIDSRIAKSILFIAQHLADKLSITQLAQQACLSPTQFKSLFKQHTGLTPMRYVTKVRMEKAQALLTHTDYPLQQIGEQVGYPTLSTFSRKFSQYCGFAPTKFNR
ncbi:AraC family transcriptional regulator [Alteromonas ponticola]|uniref:AraC family transcriptional regulator n=1 Tax=Alteromonas aquimaris TaxID=2998417 RepID=A0ABT3PBT9_9ALTE|nr:AraC family transcriptional regulator [Alteromonas aquimaris]MCW8109561.1 AraC family transcriptional regulator [Alteromonas aquimaris]